MKSRSLAAFIGAVCLLLITLGVGIASATVPGTAALRGASTSGASSSSGVSGGGGTATVLSAHSAAPPPKRVGHGPALPRGAARIGALSASTRINVDVMLAPSERDGTRGLRGERLVAGELRSTTTI